MMKPFLLTNAGLFTAGGDAPFSEGAWLLSDERRVRWQDMGCGEPPSEVADVAEVLDARGCLVTPPLVDCHTHLVFGGDRSAEFEERLKGASYEEILKAGGGIHSTVRMTSEASDEELVAAALRRVESLRAQGVSLIEVKSGYGLSVEAELRLLRVISRVADEVTERQIISPPALPVTFRRTLLLHTVPVDRREDRGPFLDEVCRNLIPRAALEGLADHIDVFCESGAFTLAESERILRAGLDAGFAAKIHSEQITASGGAAMAARLGALSCDHLEMLDDAGIEAMEEAGTVAVLLPGAQLFLRAPAPPVAKLREAGIPMAVATDCNPGSSMTTNLLLMLSLACINMRLTPTEALLGVTSLAERALDGPTARAHRIEVGAKCGPLLLWPVRRPVDLCYRLGEPLLPTVIDVTGAAER